ncbi:MAG: type II secretion system protein [Sulfuricurvum sp.]|nr:type II secretion system protein [Sulfuricurvum sp.]
MIELLFVIVILGIVGGLAIEAIRQYYNSIFRTNLYSQRAAEADHVLDQISNYFEYGIAASVVRLDKNSPPNGATCDGPPRDDSLNDEYTFAFIAVDHEGLLGFWDGNLSRWRPTWTSNVEVNTTGIIALDSNYTQANMQETLTNSAIYDFGSSSAANQGVCDDFKWQTSSTSTRYNTITAYTDTTLTLQNRPSETTDNKYLLRTGYAFRAYNGDFVMYTNFQPWKGENYTVSGGHVLAKNVAHFTVDYDVNNTQMNSTKGNVYRLKLCMFGVDENLTKADTTATNKFQICRERMVHVRY